MRKLIMWTLVSLDGYFEGPDHDIGWFEQVWGDELEAYSIEQGRSAGALLFGRVTYELMANHWPAAEGEIADFMNTLPKIVASRTLKTADWANTRIVGADVAEEIARLKEEQGKDIFLFGSADLADTLLPHGLFDELRICVVPLVLGQGTKLFKTPRGRVPLKLAATRALTSGAVILRYVPAA